MAKQTQTTDQKIINSGAMQYLMRFPAEGQELSNAWWTNLRIPKFHQ